MNIALLCLQLIASASAIALAGWIAMDSLAHTKFAQWLFEGNRLLATWGMSSVLLAAAIRF